MYSKCPRLYWERYEATDFLGTPTPVRAGGAPSPEAPPDSGPSAAGPMHSSDGRGTSNLQILDQPITGPGIELDKASEGLAFGSRMHQLLHERRCRQLGLSISVQPEWPDEAIESECQATLAAYEAHYVRDYEYLESERTHALPILRRCPDCDGLGQPKLDLEITQRCCENCGRIFRIHELVVKLDAVVRHGDGTIGPMDTKTESRPGYNTREDWAGKTQAKAYLYALKSLYPNEKVSRFVLDVVTRGQAKNQHQPIFTRLDDISSTPEALEDYIRNVNWVADDIEHSRRTGWWRSNMNLCKKGWEKCDYFALHVIGRTAQNLKLYRPAEQYLDL